MNDTPSLQVGEDLAASGTPRGTRVGLDHMKSRVERAHYFVLGDALDALGVEGEIDAQLDVMTICVLEIENGFILVGKSAPADPTNFDKAKGQTFAYEDALRQLWPFEGYLLREKLWQEEGADATDQG